MTIVWLARWNDDLNEYEMRPVVNESFNAAFRQAANCRKDGWVIYKMLRNHDLTLKEWYKLKKEARQYA